MLLLLACSALPAAAQPVRQPLPPLSAEGLRSDSFDARAFDPLGPRRPAQAEARNAPTPPPRPGAALPAAPLTQAGPGAGPSAAIAAPVQEARADTDTLRRPGVGRDLLSDWWTRQQFGGLR
ncbi:hypothetical protein BKE38_21990 [Pseudoroseomonas deserti]|uniref:Uncharacterized protein n=2 Tax=Teichococcus deserti TaxID=1817963 RepID=A0A1V2GZD8_9PROT|nr:hypothetical protein BKE38_21990 [Pseudoroseomonas deserti]